MEKKLFNENTMNRNFLLLTCHDTVLCIDEEDVLCHVALSNIGGEYHALHGMIYGNKIILFKIDRDRKYHYLHEIKEKMKGRFLNRRKEWDYIYNDNGDISLLVEDTFYLSANRFGYMELVENNNTWEMYHFFYEAHPSKLSDSYMPDIVFLGKKKYVDKDQLTTIEELNDFQVTYSRPFEYDMAGIIRPNMQYFIELKLAEVVGRYSFLLSEATNGKVLYFESYDSNDQACFSFVTGEDNAKLYLTLQLGSYYYHTDADENRRSITIENMKVLTCNRKKNVVDVQSGQKVVLKNATLLPVTICPVWNNRSGMATIISDDGHFKSGAILNELAERHNLHATVAGSVKFLESNLREWQSIENKGYVEIVNHTYNHVPISLKYARSRDEILHEYNDALKYLKRNFKTPTFTFVYPYNSTTDLGKKIISEMEILAARRGSRGNNSLQPFRGHNSGEMLNLRMHGIGDTQEKRIRDAWVDNAIINHRWLVEMWHDISTKGDVGYQPISTEEADAHMGYMAEQEKKGNLWVASFTEAVSYVYQRLNCRVWACMKDSRIWVFIVRNDSKLPWEEFNCSLTLLLQLPEDWQTARIVKGIGEGNILEKSRHGQIIFDMKCTNGQTVLEKIL